MARRRRRKPQYGWNFDDGAVDMQHTTEFCDFVELIPFDSVANDMPTAVEDKRNGSWFIKRILLWMYAEITGRTDQATKPRRRLQVGLGIGNEKVQDDWGASPSVGEANMWRSTVGPSGATSDWNDQRRVLRQEILTAYDPWHVTTIANSSDAQFVQESGSGIFQRSPFPHEGPPMAVWDIKCSEGIRDDESLILGIAVEGNDLEWEEGDGVELIYYSKILLQKKRA